MNYNRALEIQSVICEQFFFNRVNVPVFAETLDAEVEPSELVYDIFSEVIAVNVLTLSPDSYIIELLSTNDDLFLSPIIDFFNIQQGDIVSEYSNLIKQQTKKRPLEIGCSVGPLEMDWRGTLGCFVKDIDTGEDYILSNHHVLFSEIDYQDNFIVQPSRPEGGVNADAIGLYARSLAPDTSDVNDFDAAIAGPVSEKIQYLIPSVGVPVAGLAAAVVGMKVYKIGVRTGKSYGRILSITSAIKVDDEKDGTLDYQNQILIQGTSEDFVSPGNFSLKGDSGAVVFDYDTNNIVGLLFCGNDGRYSWANQINPLFEKMNIIL